MIEYNKGLELFDMHYSPTVEDLFTIIIQVSRFLKEFTDFETKKTPEFRHPFLKGKLIQLKEGHNKDEDDMRDEIGTLFDLFKMKLKKKGLYEEEAGQCLIPFKDDGVDVAEKDKTTYPQEEDENKISYLKNIGLYNELIKMNMVNDTNNVEILVGHETINVDVPAGKQKFLEHYKDIIWQKKVYHINLCFLGKEESQR